LANTIISGTGGANCAGTITSAGHNLDSGNTCKFTATGDITSTNPLLGPLQDNGGPTWTRAPSIGSPVVDKGDNATCPGVDQRGILRPIGPRCDIGAYEVLGFGSSDIPKVITSNDCIASTTTITSNDVIGRLQLGVNLDLAPRGNLSVSLSAPFGTVVQTLSTGGGGNNLNVLWDDNATAKVGTESQTMTPPYSYVRQPDSPLAGLNSHRIQGIWTLKICNGSGGTLNQWALVVVPDTQHKIYLPLIKKK